MMSDSHSDSQAKNIPRALCVLPLECGRKASELRARTGIGKGRADLEAEIVEVVLLARQNILAARLALGFFR